MTIHGTQTSSNASEFAVEGRFEALRSKHLKYKAMIKEARKNPSTTDFYLNQLKKQKLLIKDLLETEAVNNAQSKGVLS